MEIESQESISKIAKRANNDQYIASSIIRFGRHEKYIQEKLLIDFFAIKGNMMIAEGLRRYIEKNLDTLKKAKRIRILDIGPAIGAISTLIALQTLDEFGLMKKAQVHLIDVSEKVIDNTQQCNFFYPTSILKAELKTQILKKIKESKGVISSAEKMPWKDSFFTIALAGFLFHHLHDSIKPKVANEIMRVLEPNGFVGVAEEWFENYKEYAKIHKDDKIPLAYESIISYEKLKSLFPNMKVTFSYGADHNENSYTFCGTKI